MSVLASVFTLVTMGHMDMENERQIVAVLLRYATAIDQRDWPLFAECFTDDVEADYGAIGSWHGRGEIVEFMRLGHELIGPTLHRLSNFVILGDDSEATATSYVDALLMRCDPAEPPRQAHGAYHDRLVRAADGWKIRSRRFVSISMTPLVR